MTRRSSAPPAAGLDLAHSTAHWIKAAHRAFQQALQARLEPYGIKLSHWHCLRYLCEEDGLTQRELSRRVDVKESTLVAVIREMEQLGLVRRVRDRQDQRKYMLSLTPRARRITRQLLPVAGLVNQQGTSGFSHAEIDQYRALTRRLVANLEAGPAAAESAGPRSG